MMNPRKSIDAAVAIIRTQAEVIEKAQDLQELAEAIEDVEAALGSLRSVVQERPIHGE